MFKTTIERMKDKVFGSVEPSIYVNVNTRIDCLKEFYTNVPAVELIDEPVNGKLSEEAKGQWATKKTLEGG